MREMIAYDANSTVRWIAEELNTTKDMIHEILTQDLNKQKVCARFVYPNPKPNPNPNLNPVNF